MPNEAVVEEKKLEISRDGKHGVEKLKQIMNDEKEMN